MNNRTLQRDANNISNIIDELIGTIKNLESINENYQNQIEFLENNLEEANDKLEAIKDL